LLVVLVVRCELLDRVLAVVVLGAIVQMFLVR